MQSAETQIAAEVSRQELAKQQTALIGALKFGNPLPEGFCQRHAAVAAKSLAHKRAACIRKAVPWLAEALGDSFPLYLAEFTQSHPAPPADGPRADALAFARWLEQRRLLPDSCLLQMEIAAASSRWTLKIIRLPASHRMAVIVQLPLLGVRVFTLPVGGKAEAARS